MAPKQNKGTATSSGDVPWRTGGSIPRISSVRGSVLMAAPEGLALQQYALSIMKHPDPIGMGLASEAYFEAAGEGCLIPGMVKPVRVLGLQVWPIGVKNPMKNAASGLEPLGRELRTLGSLVDKALDLMNSSFSRR
eukprot:TRINITY_DN1049_c0_g2_i1.p1 TRINITY_DN1049_c0_g2~~TRINITY_DN1049_c0_g2_i1.p1  ORF type:complete len:136 (-),score=17.76 TRINITY_DN1049_c0_g2_i1:384-791(-)